MLVAMLVVMLVELLGSQTVASMEQQKAELMVLLLAYLTAGWLVDLMALMMVVQ